jgi:hypothetical protein
MRLLLHLGIILIDNIMIIFHKFDKNFLLPHYLCSKYQLKKEIYILFYK